jgi:hypothetical protein
MFRLHEGYENILIPIKEILHGRYLVKSYIVIIIQRIFHSLDVVVARFNVHLTKEDEDEEAAENNECHNFPLRESFLGRLILDIPPCNFL